MSKVRVLVGTKKGAFVLTADGKRRRWDVSGPHFAGWEIYHLKGSPADPDRLYASQPSGWVGPGGVAARSRSPLRGAVERLVRPGDPALRRWWQDVGDAWRRPANHGGRHA